MPVARSVSLTRYHIQGKHRKGSQVSNPVLVEVTRGDRVESVHCGAIAVCDANGGLRLAVGDVSALIYPRSSLKPIQAIPLIETGAAAQFSSAAEEIALACASHSGEPQHTSRIAAWLEKIGCSVADLACGPHRPIHEATANEMIARGEQWTPLHNNCSGKQTGVMTTARALHMPIAGYTLSDTP